MTNYITLTINEDMLMNLFYVYLFFLAIWVIYLFVDLIQTEIRRQKEREKEIVAEPYKKEYEKLLKEGDHKKILEFEEKYEKYLKDAYYYW